jgi:hypothetical protein
MHIQSICHEIGTNFCIEAWLCSICFNNHGTIVVILYLWHQVIFSSGRVINPTQRPLPDNTQHSQETNIHKSGWIRTRNPSKRPAADVRLRQRGYQDWRLHCQKINLSRKFRPTLHNCRHDYMINLFNLVFASYIYGIEDRPCVSTS